MNRAVREALLDRWDRIPDDEREGLIAAFGRAYWLLLHDDCPDAGCLYREGFLCAETWQQRRMRVEAA